MPPDKHSRTICETQFLRLSHVWENVYLTDIRTRTDVFLGSFYGDPTCGLISTDEKWCVVGGSTCLCWREGTVQEINDPELCWVFECRQTGEYIVEMLIDPWANHSAIWALNIRTFEKRKIRDFPSYKNQPYTTDIYW